MVLSLVLGIVFTALVCGFFFFFLRGVVGWGMLIMMISFDVVANMHCTWREVHHRDHCHNFMNG